MTDKQYNQFLRDNVLPTRPSKLHKSKLVLAPNGYLKPKDVYYTKSFEGDITEWVYTPCSTTYRSDITKMVQKKLIYVEKSEDLIIFEHNTSIQTELFDEKV
tara:strand:+ start:509 stop:814 length:306 start_codon:yes stop_codon:yes gene_type:complete